MIPLKIHDFVFASGALILFLAMIPAVARKAVIPLSTCLTTGAVLLVFTINYVTMSYWYAAVVEAGNVLCWGYLLKRSLSSAT